MINVPIAETAPKLALDIFTLAIPSIANTMDNIKITTIRMTAEISKNPI